MMMMMWMRRRIKFQSVDAIVVLFDNNKQLTIAALRIYHIYSSLTAHDTAHPSGV